MYVHHIREGVQGKQNRVWGPLGLELQVGVSQGIQGFQGIQVPERAARASNC